MIRALTVWVLLAATSGASGAAGTDQVDAAPFGRPLLAEDSAGVEWPEVRRISRVEITFAGKEAPVPAPASMQVEYWHRVWNGAPVRRYGEENAGRTGWVPNDDWFTGEWKTADTRGRVEGRKVSFTFAPSHETEFPDLKVPGVTYRPTLKLRVKFAGSHPRIASLNALTDSLWQTPERIRVEFEKREQCKDPMEVYNGWVVENSTTSTRRGNACWLEADVTYARNWEDPEADRTIVTLRSPSHPFSFAVDEVIQGDRLFVKDFGVLVTRASDPVTISEHRAALEQSGAKTVYDRVEDHAEQTLGHAWSDMPLKRPYYFILGLEGGRQRFRLNPTGGLWVNRPNFSERRPGKDNGHFHWPDGLTYQFGLPASPFSERTLAEGFLPIVTTRWLDGSLLYEQEAFADVLAATLNAAPPMQSDDSTVAFIKFRIVNSSGAPQTARLRFSTYIAVRDSKETKE
ncbi:MAG: hypothetical protein HYS33_04730, partial [Acidobacteria bacterium]|nr:hypothetical protein [Acidobacteriota bacterium]